MGLGSGIRDPGSGKNLFRIPDPEVKKAPDPGSATLLACRGVALVNLFRGRTGRLGRAERGRIVVFLFFFLGSAAEDDAFAQ
jgi:hypothetical protein